MRSPSLPPPDETTPINSELERGLTSKWWVLIAVGIGTFMSALDISVINTILPVVAREFKTDIATVEWVVVIYLLAVSGLLLSFGRLGYMRGHRPVYISGFFIFILSSMLCGLSQSVTILVACRLLQALGAAMLSANSPAILTKSFPGSQRGQALGLQATMTYLGLTIGPTLGGWLTDQFNWRAVFFINLPVGLLALALSLRFIPKDEKAKLDERFDLRGAFLFIAGLVVLLLALNQGHSWGWLSLPILTFILSSTVFLWLFVKTEQRVNNPMLDLSLFSSRVFSATTISAILNYICVYSILFLMPFYLIQGRQLSPSQAGLVLSAMPVIMAIIAPISGTVSDYVGTRLPGTLGMIILACGMLMLSRSGPMTPLPQIALSLAVSGFGIGTFISPNNSALMGAAPRNRQGIAAGILATGRNVGMVLGVGIAGAILTTIMARNIAMPASGTYQGVQAGFMMTTIAAILGAIMTAVGNPRSAGKQERMHPSPSNSFLP